MSQTQYAVLAQFLLYLGVIFPFQLSNQMGSSVQRGTANTGRRYASITGQMRSLRGTSAITIFTLAMATSTLASQARPNVSPISVITRPTPPLSSIKTSPPPLVQHRFKVQRSPDAGARPASPAADTEKTAKNNSAAADKFAKTILAISGEGPENNKEAKKGSNEDKKDNPSTKKATETSKAVGGNNTKNTSNGGEEDGGTGSAQTSGENKMTKKPVPKKTPPNTNNNVNSGLQRAQTSEERSIATMLRCQDLETRRLIPAATACKNSRSDRVCSYLFTEVDVRTGKRDIKCNLQGLEDIAESCRRTCGICCEDINYSCEDDYNGIIDCTKQLDKCHINKWFGVLSRFCAGSCGLCARTACRDYDNTCRVRKALCLKEETMDYMRENCARTCGFCIVGDLSERPGELLNETGGTTATNPSNGDTSEIVPSITNMVAKNIQQSGKMPRILERPSKSINNGGGSGNQGLMGLGLECSDKVNNCTSNEDLCSSPVYSEYMLKFCTKTCLKCGNPVGPPVQMETINPPPAHRYYQSRNQYGADRDIMEMMNNIDAETLKLREPPPIPQLTAEVSIAGVGQNGRPLLSTNVISPAQPSTNSVPRQERACLDRHHK